MSQAITPDVASKGEGYRGLSTPIDRFIIALASRVGGRRAKEVERFIKFAFIGLLGFVIDFGLLFLLQSTVLPAADEQNMALPLNVALATTISFTLAVSSNFTWNRLWTYPDSRSYSVRRQLTQFAIVSVIGWIGRTIWITSSFAFFGIWSTAAIQNIFSSYHPVLQDELKLGTMISQFIGVIVVMIWNFLANRYWTFNDVE
ncbi:MAG: GtrA family protein [Chloroflexota bacterium]|nr:GtrA family protein [Chloroflexota bacterium]